MLMFNRNASFAIQDLHSWICHGITEVELFDYICLWNCINVWLCCFLNRTKNSNVRNKGDCSVSSASFCADENGAPVSYTHAGIRLKVKLDDSLYSVAVPQETSHCHLFSKVFCEFCHHILSKSHFLSLPESSRPTQHFSGLVCQRLTWQQAHHRLAQLRLHHHGPEPGSEPPAGPAGKVVRPQWSFFN